MKIIITSTFLLSCHSHDGDEDCDDDDDCEDKKQWQRSAGCRNVPFYSNVMLDILMLLVLLLTI